MDFSLSFSVVFPLCVYIFIGIVSRKFGLLDEKTANKMNSMVFRVLFPIMMFSSIQSAGAALESGDLGITWVGLLIVSALLVLLIIIVPLAVKDKARQISIIMGAFRGNGLLFSLPIVAGIYGEENTGFVAACLAVLVPFYNIVSVLLFNLGTGKKIKIKALIIEILKNPVIIGSLAGILVLISGIKIPVILQKPISALNSMVSPLALILLGAGLKFGKLKEDFGHIAIAAFLKLVVYPGITLGISYMLGYRGIPLVSLFVMNFVPTAVGAYTMSKEMGSDGDFVGELVASSTIASLATMFLWIIFLSAYNLF